MCAAAARAGDQTTQVGKVLFHHSLTGKTGAPPIVFISGYTGDMDLWKPIADPHEKTHQVLRFDNQGIGGTEDDGGPLTIEAMASNTWGLIDALSLTTPAVIVGFAMGSCIALEMARTRPEGCKQLVLLSPVVKWSAEAQKRIDQLIALREASEAEGAGTAEHETAARALYDLAFGAEFKKRVDFPTFLAGLPEPAQSLISQKRQATALKSFDASSWAHTLRNIIPTTILSPTEDLFALPSDADMLAEKTGGELVTISCGHAAIAEAPGAIQEILGGIVRGKSTDPTHGSRTAHVFSTRRTAKPEEGSNAGHEP